ncbi:uncharacterized protein LOC117221468 isoform X1 [Megalopta genalis]|uniref:uncharacterized protein LOC117221468 isoform X1 n=1 Tax=Megalopta genalis TaxID=115081 RepID=UPI003FD03995
MHDNGTTSRARARVAHGVCVCVSRNTGRLRLYNARPGKVRPLNRRLSKRQAYQRTSVYRNMKLCLPVVLVALVATLLHSAVSESADSDEACSLENCIAPDKCDIFIENAPCPQAGVKCCSIVKRQHRTHCAHHGGICMEKCALFLQHNAVDCTDGQVCCVLV